MEAAIDDDAVSAPEGVVELDQLRAGDIHNPEADRVEFAPHGPAFVKNRVGEEATETTGMAELSNELEVVPGVGLMHASQLQTVVLANLSGFASRVGLVEAEVIDPKNASVGF